MESKQCVGCGKSFHPQSQTSKQTYCASATKSSGQPRDLFGPICCCPPFRKPVGELTLATDWCCVIVE